MKSGTPYALLAALAAAGRQYSSLGLLHNPRPLSQSPPYNQRKARKARRQRHAAGIRHAFKTR